MGEKTNRGRAGAIRKIYASYPKEIISSWHTQAAAASAIKISSLRKSMTCEENYLFFRKTKFQKAINKLDANSAQTQNIMTPKEISFDLTQIKQSRQDINKKVNLPNKLTPELAEETGIHLGDGTLSTNRNYFSVRGGYNEETYYTDFVLPLYKRLYNISPRLIKRWDACGFEISSKTIKEFKTKILGITTGEKIHKIIVPDCILKSTDKAIYCAFLRGLFDTDGCYYYNKKKQYPVISLCIKSIKLITKVNEMIQSLGYSPYLHEKTYTIILNGFPQFNQWIKEIRSNNPKNIKRIETIKNTPAWIFLNKISTYKNND